MTEFRLPELGEGVYEAEFVEWRVAVGEAVVSGQVLCEVLTDKANMDVPAPFAGTIEALVAEPGEQIKVGDVILSYAGQRADSMATAAVGQPTAGTAPNGEPAARRAAGESAATTVRRPVPSAAAPATPATHVLAAPSVRRMARALGVDLGQVRGSGRRGRVLIDDLGQHAARSSAPRDAPAERPHAGIDLGVAGTQVKLQGVRRMIAEQMVRSVKTIPHYTYIDECNATELVRLRESLKETYLKGGVRLTYLAFVVKAIAGALAEVPLVNATLDDAEGVIHLHDVYHIGVATSTARGLMVPVVHDANRRDLGETAREIERLTQAARDGRIGLEDLRGGTFTVTSIGNIGGLVSTPIINHPEVGIVGIGKITRQPAFDRHDRVVAVDKMYLSFSFDHRVVDGAVGAVFGNAVIRRLENPAALLVS